MAAPGRVQVAAVVFQQRLAEAVDAAERRPEVVRHRIGKGVELGVRRLELGRVAPQLLVSPPALGDVPDDRRERGRGTLVRGGERELEGELAAVLPPARELDGRADDPGLACGEIAPHPGAVRRVEAIGHQRRDLPPHDLRTRVTEDALGCRIEVGDVPGAVGRDDGIIGRDRQRAELPFARPQRFLHLLPLGHVTGDLGEADQRALTISQRRNQDVRPEARPVASDSPPLVLCSPVRDRAAELSLRLACRHVLGGVEAREGLADDFVGAISLEPLGAGVPARDPSLGVEPEDGVIVDALHQRTEALFALLQDPLRPLPGGEIPADLKRGQGGEQAGQHGAGQNQELGPARRPVEGGRTLLQQQLLGIPHVLHDAVEGSGKSRIAGLAEDVLCGDRTARAPRVDHLLAPDQSSGDQFGERVQPLLLGRIVRRQAAQACQRGRGLPEGGPQWLQGSVLAPHEEVPVRRFGRRHFGHEAIQRLQHLARVRDPARACDRAAGVLVGEPRHHAEQQQRDAEADEDPLPESHGHARCSPPRSGESRHTTR